MARTIWAPQEKQAKFQARREYEALYGGAAGGGKSDALLAEALRQVHIPHYRGLLVRRTYPELEGLIDRSREIYKRAFPRARYVGNEYYWRFPSGAKIYFRSMQHEKDKTKFQGLQYDFIGVDELTHFAWSQYSYLMSRNRPNGEGTRVYIRATTNPGGNGHGWVRDRFITAAPPLTTVYEEVEVIWPDGHKTTERRDRVFVPASLFDNKILMRNDPQYMTNLAMMPKAERDALLYGLWDSFEGQVFMEWRNDPAHYDDQQWTHVVRPFRIPKSWRVYRGFDWGYAKPFSVGWYAADPDGRIFRIAEYYGCTGTPNEGIRMNVAELAAQIRRIEGEDENLKGRKIFGYADPSIFAQNGGQTTADIMALAPHCVYWEKADNTRIAGKMQMHYRFAFDEEGYPMFQVFDTCVNFIRTIPTLNHDIKHVEDVDTEQEDHIYDECRYVLMANPISPRENVLAREDRYGDDPLSLRPGTGDDRYKFYRI